MSNSIKLLCVMVLVLLGACAPKEEPIIPNSQEVDFEDPIGLPVTSPVSIPYVWNNPIKLTTYTETETQQAYTSFLKITGLKDKSVEQKINLALKNKFNEFTGYNDLKTLPAFRGIRQKVKDGATVQTINVYVNPTFNANNVLSVSYSLFLSILNPDQSLVYVSLTDGMTFELIHGETINLSDVFTDDADISKLINDSLSVSLSKLNESWWPYTSLSLSQIKPFTGIQSDQAFFVSEAGLHILFDHRTPNFETNFSTATMTVKYVDFLNYIGLTNRFSASPDLYENPIIDRQFLILDDDQSESSVDTLTFGSRDFHIRVSYPINLDHFLIDVLLEEKATAKYELDSFAQTHSIEYLSGNFKAEQIGTYTCLFASYEAYAGPDSIFDSEFKCYDKHLEVVNLKDYFKPGFDYVSAIKTALQNEIKDGYLNKDVSIDELFNNMEMRIQTTGFYISSFAYSPTADMIQYLGMAPLFSVFGVDNLTVFD